jgi:hypothetical protein
MRTTGTASDIEADRKKRIRRSAMLYGGIALAFYAAYIVMALVRGWP